MLINLLNSSGFVNEDDVSGKVADGGVIAL